MPHDFSGQTAIVTGAASGIGLAIARDLAKGGARVVLSDLHEEALAKAAEGLEGALTKVCDVSDPEAVEALVGFAVERTGGLHLLVNNAGIGGPAAVVGEYPLDGWEKVIAINLNGVFYGMRFGLPAIEKAGGGAVVNMASILGTVGFANSSAYVAAKHAVVGLTKSAALEYGTRGVRINAVGPGFIRTPLLDANLDQPTMDFLAGQHAVKRMGTAEEVSALTCFLLSKEASFVTGSYHLVDGGYTAQ
ncbi:SDR family NAD(P)-dependent oxidoreductase [Rubellimicrobium sp. CFH 75288]|uniref:SDR family NAD(P)-dependent oxidoreductase n=1 Tax=Rubellimicrobium sp. CFH 75288 TaxID=2697034 RepID=UPI0014121621|nr:SDR family oxidoreductase [Rubellimicrobium sp. CFH 75288]NAZ37945.1 SDR family oxidoreductase [Rubellimicrobium sp. CFH 75288]